MKITRTNITIRGLVEGYSDKGESGITGFNGKLNIRPAYQREFIYGEKERNAVIDSVSKGFPLNTMFWAENDDGTYELLDGQQRTISISQFVTNEFSMKNFLEKPDCYFKNLSDDNKNKILDYVLDIYICKGRQADGKRLDGAGKRKKSRSADGKRRENRNERCKNPLNT